MPDSFFEDLPEEKVEVKPEEKVEEPKAEVKKEEPVAKTATEISLERKSTALAEERRKRKALEAEIAELKGKKDEPEDEPKPDVLDRKSIIEDVRAGIKQDEYSNKVVGRIGFIAKGAGKTKQWALKVKETVDTLPQNLRSGDPETDTQTAIRFLESSGSAGSFTMPTGGSAFDLPSTGSSDERLSSGGRDLARQRLNLTDEQVDKFLSEPQIKMQDGAIGFKLIK